MAQIAQNDADPASQATQTAAAPAGGDGYQPIIHDADTVTVTRISSEPTINKLSSKSLVALGVGAAIIMLATLDQQTAADLLSLMLRAFIAIVILYGLYNFVKSNS